MCTTAKNCEPCLYKSETAIPDVYTLSSLEPIEEYMYNNIRLVNAMLIVQIGTGKGAHEHTRK